MTRRSRWAEGIAGTEEAFGTPDDETGRREELGLTQSTFVNPWGQGRSAAEGDTPREDGAIGPPT